MVLRSLALCAIQRARVGVPVPFVPGSMMPTAFLFGPKPIVAVERWGVVFDGLPEAWAPGLVLSGLDCDFVRLSESLAHSDAFDAWEIRSCGRGVSPVVVCFWVLPSGAAVIISLKQVRPWGAFSAAC